MILALNDALRAEQARLWYDTCMTLGSVYMASDRIACCGYKHYQCLYCWRRDGRADSRVRLVANAARPAESWPQSLKTAVRIMLTSRQPFWLGWGEQLIKLYNDPYKAIVGGKHPNALGQPAAIVWREIWSDIGPMLTTAMGGVEGTYVEAQLLIMERNGYPEETYYTFSYSPIPNDEGGVGGILCANTDDTQRVIGERQLALLRELAARTADARTSRAVCTSIDCLENNPYDLPFAMIYLVDRMRAMSPRRERLWYRTEPPGRSRARGHRQCCAWPFAEVLATNRACLVSDVSTFDNHLPKGAWDRSPNQVVTLPIAAQGPTGKAGMLVVGLNPYRLFDDQYRGFLELVAARSRQVSPMLRHMKRSAIGPRRLPSLIAPKQRSSRMSATSFARR